MKKTLLASAIALSLGLGTLAFAQSPPVGGTDAKGNAPLKHMHTVNDGSAKPGANSFTEGQARQHMVNSGYSDVTGLAKGQDGVWRGMASHNGAQVNVAMDFKGNVTEATGGASAMTPAPMQAPAPMPASKADHTGMVAGGAAAGGMAAGAMMMHHHHHHMMHHMRRHHHGHCANPGANGAACSGIDTNGSGVSDREKQAIHAGAHP